MSEKTSSDLAISAEETSNSFQCIYEVSEEYDNENSSQNSIDSSELADDSDDEVEVITEFYILNKKLNKIDNKK